MIKPFRTIVVAAISLSAAQAHALNTRTWISGKGADVTGCGPIASPCRSLQFAHDQTSPGGEIDVLDSAGYGSIVINKAITIINEGGVAGVLASVGGDAVTINAGATDAVVLRGLTVEGSKVGANGIVFNSAGALTIANCLVQGFVGTGTAGNGIRIVHTSGAPGITISDTTASYNQSIGIVYSPSGTAGGLLSISGVTASHNGYGMSIYVRDATGNTFANIVRSKVLNNDDFGLQVVAKGNVQSRAWLHDSVVMNNRTDGIKLIGFVAFGITRSISSYNAPDLSVSNGPAVYSDKTNVIIVTSVTPFTVSSF